MTPTEICVTAAEQAMLLGPIPQAVRIEFKAMLDNQDRVEVVADYTPPVPAPPAMDPSSGAYATEGEPPDISIVEIRCECGAPIPEPLWRDYPAMDGLEAQGLRAGENYRDERER